MYGCESWTVKKAECRRIDAFELWCWRRLLRVSWTARRSNQSILKEINPDYSLGELMLKLKLQYFSHLMQRADSLEKTLMLGKFSSVQLLSRVWLFAIPWTAARQAYLSNTSSWSLLKLMSIESVMPSKHLILCRPLLLLPQSFPASGSFPMSQFFISGGQSSGVSVSTSVLPINIQDWSPLGWTGWISLQSKGLSRVFSNTTVQKHQFFGTQLSSQSNSHIHTRPLEKP